MNEYHVYIMASRMRTLYTGVTRDLERRVYEHKYKLKEGFTKRYNVTRLVYFEAFRDIRDAIARSNFRLGICEVSVPSALARIHDPHKR